jgi:hypothetical protein
MNKRNANFRQIDQDVSSELLLLDQNIFTDMANVFRESQHQSLKIKSMKSVFNILFFLLVFCFESCVTDEVAAQNSFVRNPMTPNKRVSDVYAVTNALVSNISMMM